MSASSSMLHVLEAQHRNEYPFPIVDPVEPHSSPSDSPPETSHSKSHRSGGSAPRHHRRYDRERDNDLTSTSARLLSRLASRDDRDIKHVRTLLVLTTERLESETRRADQAEQRILDTLHRLRAAHEATAAARAETARAHESVQLYKLQLDYAQREITRAQEILDQVERERAEAEAEAARARTTARRLREDNLVTKALEQGRKEGYQEGFSIGRSMVVGGGKMSPRGAARRFPMRQAVDDDEEEEEEPMRTRTPSRRTPSAIRITPPQTTYAPRPRLATNFDVRHRSGTPARIPERVPDVAPRASPHPVPTLTSPAGAPSPFRAEPSPSPVPVPGPNVRQSRTELRDHTPTPIYDAPPSPSHPPYDVLPDNWIPYANDTRDITVPPPHELSRPVTPVTPATPNAPLSETILPMAAPSQETLVRPPSVRSRDFAYANRTNPSLFDGTTRGRGGAMSPQSRTSTRISEYDILGPSRTVRGAGGGTRSIRSTLDSYDPGPSTASSSLRAPTRSRTPGPTGLDRPPSPRGPRNSGEVPVPVIPPGSSAARGETDGGRRPSTDNRGPLVQLFKKRFRSRTSPPESSGRAVPDIFVESPSTPRSSSSSEQTTNAPHLLSPDYLNRPLPTPEPSVSMRQEPDAPLPIPTTEVLDVLPPGFMPSPSPEGRNRQTSGLSRPASPYAEAPMPSGIVYPDPPTRSMTPSAIDDLYGTGSSPRNSASRGRRGSLATSGGLSPLSIGKPLTFFSFPNPDDVQGLPIS